MDVNGSKVTSLNSERLRRKAAAMRRPSVADLAAGLCQDLARLALEGGGDPETLLVLAERAGQLARRLREQGRDA